MQHLINKVRLSGIAPQQIESPQTIRDPYRPVVLYFQKGDPSIKLGGTPSWTRTRTNSFGDCHAANYIKGIHGPVYSRLSTPWPLGMYVLVD